MKERIRELGAIIEKANYKKDGFILYCICFELLDILERLINSNKASH